MAVVTKYMLAEEILRILQGGNQAAGAKVTKFDLYASIAQVANTVLKASYISDGEAIPNGAMIASYDNIAVASTGQTSTAQLPVKPIKLPRNMGVYSIYDPANPVNEFIPIEMGHANLLNSQPILNDIIYIGYENFGMEIRFNTDLTLLSVPFVSMRLVVLDISLYSEWDPLPIIADQEYTIKKEVLALHGMQMAPADKLVNFNKEQHQPVQTQQQT